MLIRTAKRCPGEDDGGGRRSEEGRNSCCLRARRGPVKIQKKKKKKKRVRTAKNTRDIEFSCWDSGILRLPSLKRRSGGDANQEDINAPSFSPDGSLSAKDKFEKSQTWFLCHCRV